MSIKQQLLDVFSKLGKSAEDVYYYRISPWSKSSTLKGASANIFDFMILLDKLDKINHLCLGMIVFHDNTWLVYNVDDREWEYNCPPSYDELVK